MEAIKAGDTRKWITLYEQPESRISTEPTGTNELAAEKGRKAG